LYQSNAETTIGKALILTRNFSSPYCDLKWGNNMTDNTLTRMDLSEAVFREVGLSRNESAQLVESVLDHISDALVKGEQVKISSFGTFSVRSKSARVGRNPKTGEEVPINPRRVLTFRPSHLMKDRVALGNKS
jgi:integration host factor subunit alpha